jgi:hypothetical protein
MERPGRKAIGFPHSGAAEPPWLLKELSNLDSRNAELDGTA